ncbi:MAG: AAA domain-containing protein [Planctomycetes bacterium]|nr:AAA domain-containing protein [Planctomycetota bacterium]
MEKWNKINQSHVVKIFRDVAYKWWGLDVHFYDKFANATSKEQHYRSPLCSLIHTNKKEAEECLLYGRQNIIELNGSPGNFMCKNCENMKILSLPIVVKGDCIGWLVCSGMQFPISNDQRRETIKRIATIGVSKTDLLESYDGIIISNSHTEEYALSLMKMVVKDISSFIGIHFDEYSTKMEQRLFMESRRNEKYKSIIGTSKSMEMIFNKLDLIENSESPVLILGETGTGKELIATTIHYNSTRRNKAFVIQNCSAFSDTILSSELFGHEKGSFTGAISQKKGIFEIADGGTLFLDEIGDLGIEVQGKLLRVLENGTFYRVGGTEEMEVNVRILTATNKDLSNMVEEVLFRRDLLFRINTLRIEIPPLRQREDDIEPLFFHFLEHYADEKIIGRKRLHPNLIKMLKDHHWAGNIRELKNVVESLITMSSQSDTLEPEHLLLEGSGRTACECQHKSSPVVNKRLSEVVSSADRELVSIVLQKSNWNKTRAARALGTSRASLNRRIEKYNIVK